MDRDLLLLDGDRGVVSVVTTAICCWCRGPLLKHPSGTWWCGTEVCVQRQLDWSMTTQDRKGKPTGFLNVPLPRQVAFWSCPARYVLYGGAAGATKSHGLRWGMYWWCLAIPGLECLLLRKNYGELDQTHLRRMESDQHTFRNNGVAAEFIKGERLFKFPNGSLIQAGHMDDPEAVERYLSTEYDIIGADEGSQFPVDADGHAPIIALSSRARTTKSQVLASPLGRGKFWLGTNPGGPSAPAILDFFIDHTPDFERYPQLRTLYKPDEWAYIPGQLEDNPYLDAQYEADLAVNSKWRYEQLRHGNWRVFAGQFFSEWREAVHVRELAA